MTGQRGSLPLTAPGWFSQSGARANRNREELGGRSSPAMAADIRLPRAKHRAAASDTTVLGSHCRIQIAPIETSDTR